MFGVASRVRMRVPLPQRKTLGTKTPTCDADEPDLARLAGLVQRRESFVHDDVEGRRKLGVVDLDDVDVVQAQPREALVDAGQHALSAKVEHLEVVGLVPANLGREVVRLARDPLQRLTKDPLALLKPVPRRRVNQVDSCASVVRVCECCSCVRVCVCVCVCVSVCV